MRFGTRHDRRALVAAVFGVALAVATATSALAANFFVIQISEDPFTNPGSAHNTQVEPDTFAFGSTLVMTFQSGRFFDGGASDIGWATSLDGGATFGAWTHGFLPGITPFQGGGAFDRVSDPAVAYDARHKVWLISSLAINVTPHGDVVGAAVLVSRSTDGGLTWGDPITVAHAGPGGDLDKEWIVCDDTASSPFFGRCYVEFDDFGLGDRIFMSTSTDGGKNWGPAKTTADNQVGFGGQPVVQPNGTVIVPIFGTPLFDTQIAFRSTDGGAHWSRSVVISPAPFHLAAGKIRDGSSPLPSAEVDRAGRVYVVWQDCRFRPACSANDIVMSTSTDGLTWSPVVRIPIDPISSPADHFLPGLGVNRNTAGHAAELGLSYHFYPDATCTAATCRLGVGFISSDDAGATWGGRTTLVSGMQLGWLAPTSQGPMTGDYVSTSFARGVPRPGFVIAGPKNGSLFDEFMATVLGTLPSASSAAQPASAEGAVLPNASHQPPAAPPTRR